MLTSAARTTLHRRTALLQANIGVLGQKLELMSALRSTLGPLQANQRFAEKCPVIGASVGQHFRHSTDHMERVADSIETEKRNDNREIHYDVRVRGGNDEKDMDAAEKRIRRISGVFQANLDAMISSSSVNNINAVETDYNATVLACFMLSGDPTEDEFFLTSTIERELGFVAHHAIHHLAMVKVITIHTLNLIPSDALPAGFGMAPSTIVYDNSTQQ